MSLAPSERPLLRVAASTTLTVLAFSLLNPVLAVRLQSEGTSASAIGFLMMLPFLTVAVLVPWMPWLFQRCGGVAQALRLGLLVEVASALGNALATDYALRCVCVAVSGVGAAAVWNATEALIAHNAPAHLRGRITGLYQTALGAAMAVGPWLPGAIPATPQSLMLLAAGLIALGWIACQGAAVGALRTGTLGHAPTGSLWHAVRRAPELVVVAFVGGVFEVGLSSLLTAFGAQSGLTLAAATSLAGALGLGSFVLQYPCGWLADHWPLRRLLGTAGILLLLASLGFALGTQWLPAWWASAFVWGAVGGALYTLTMIRVAQTAHGDTVASTAAVIAGYTLGGTVGPALSGVMLELGGATAQMGWLTLLSLGVLGMAWRTPPH